MLEIYNESVYDLLTASGEDLDLHLKPRSEEVYVKGLSWEEVNTGMRCRSYLYRIIPAMLIRHHQPRHCCSIVTSHQLSAALWIIRGNFGFQELVIMPIQCDHLWDTAQCHSGLLIW